MPPRQFNGMKLRIARRRTGLSQERFGARLGLSKATIVQYEKFGVAGGSAPPPERLPSIAEALGADLETMFPRVGEPDLADLRADAGLTQAKAAELLRTTRVPLSQAENGSRKLPLELRAKAAALYGVTPEELEAAETRSSPKGRSGPFEAGDLPAETLSEKIRAVLADRPQVTDEAVAAAVNHAAGSSLGPQDIAALRSRTRAAEEVFAGLPMGAVREGLASALGVTPFDFMPGQQVEQQVMAGLQYLADQRGGGPRMAARGETIIAPEMYDVLVELLARQAPEQGSKGA
ncbi:helix-turn-helix domain-containing protein [Streptomyces luteireticuli]|uniref:helix-turn-helix domain-containing protein n=1 Tax=Streptomyces luteireticuli TaxID=173858 RepID=UPI003556C90F